MWESSGGVIPRRTTGTNWWCCGQEVNYPRSSSDRRPTQEIELRWSPILSSALFVQEQVGDLMLQKPRGTQCGHHRSCQGLQCAKIERKVQDGIWMPELYYNFFARNLHNASLNWLCLIAHFIPPKKQMGRNRDINNSFFGFTNILKVHK